MNRLIAWRFGSLRSGGEVGVMEYGWSGETHSKEKDVIEV